jgi:hypothetical protein
MTADEELRFSGNSSSAKGRRNNPSHRTMSNQALSFSQAWFIWVTGRKIAQKPAISGAFNARSYFSVLSGKRYCTAKIRRRAAGPPQGR